MRAVSVRQWVQGSRLSDRARQTRYRQGLNQRPEGWGRSEGREVYQRLLDFVEHSAGTLVFEISMKDVKRVDISFSSETIIELARRYRRTKGFCLVDLNDKDMIENLDAAAAKKEQPMLVGGTVLPS